VINQARKRWVNVASILLGSLILVAGSRSALAGVAPERSLRRSHAGPRIVRRMVLGHSTQGRPIIAFRLGAPTSETKILVVGCIHGNECAGTVIARALIATPPSGIDLWVIRNLNPDGFHARTRQNAHGVDLNRNFPYRWRHVGRPWDKEYSGPHPLSEPEDRIARRSIADSPGASGLPLVRLRGPYPGSVTRWQNHWHPEASAFVVELPSGSPSPTAVDRYANAIVHV
jgi:murein peptide amidase A